MPIRTGIVGHGNIGGWHAYLVHKLPDSDVVAICDREDERLEAVDDRLDVNLYNNLDAMVSEMDLDSIHVCTPPQTHLPIASTALENDIHTLIEKPLATSVADAEELVSLATRSDALASVVHHRLFEPMMRNARTLVEQGRIGDVVSTTMLFGEHRDLDETPRGDWVYDLPGGEIGEGLAHQVYMALGFSEGLGEVTNVETQKIDEYTKPIEFDGLRLCMSDVSGEQLISIQALANSDDQDTLYVHGTDGMIRVDRETMTTTLSSPATDSSVPTNVLSKGRKLVERAKNKLRSSISPVTLKLGYGSLYSGHYRQIQLYQNAIRSNTAPPVTMTEALDTVRVIDAVRSRSSPSNHDSRSSQTDS